MQRSLARLGCSTARHCRCVSLRPPFAPVAPPFRSAWTRSRATDRAESSSAPLQWLVATRGSRARGFKALAAGAEGNSPLRLVIYSRDDCPLCDGLKEKVDLALQKAQFMQSRLTGASVEVRDITSRPEWEAVYALSIPVLKVVAPGTDHELEVRRAPPRASSDRVAQNILAALDGQA